MCASLESCIGLSMANHIPHVYSWRAATGGYPLIGISSSVGQNEMTHVASCVRLADSPMSIHSCDHLLHLVSLLWSVA